MIIYIKNFITHPESTSISNKLASINNQVHLPNVPLGAAGINYTLGGAAETSRTELTGDGWTINDSGGV